MDTKKQKLLLEYLISSPDTFGLCSSIIKPDYFNPELRKAVEFIQSYHTTYNNVPTPEQISAESGVQLAIQGVTKDQINYCATEVEQFCKHGAMRKAVLSAPALIDKGDFGKVEELIKAAVTTSLQRNLGVNYFDHPLIRLNKIATSNSLVSTGWAGLDEALFGGINRKEMILFSANSGGGKSIAMANLAVNLMESGLNVLYLSLELFEDMVAKRFDSMITGIGQREWSERIYDINTILETRKEKLGKLFIKYFPSGTNSITFRAYLKEFELQYGLIPDVLIVDYIDLMSPNEYVPPDNVFQKDKQCSEQLRNIGAEYDMYIVTASQQNRSAVGSTDPDQSHIAGGISKINTTDIHISIIMSDLQKASGEIAFKLIKTRSSDGMGKIVNLRWDRVSLRITNLEQAPSTTGPNKGLKTSGKQVESGLESPTKPIGLLDMFQVDKG